MNLLKKFYIAAILIFTGFGTLSACGQHTQQNDMAGIARAIAKLMPEMDGRINDPIAINEHFIRFDLKGENGRETLHVYRYTRPAAATDLVLAAYDIEDFPIGNRLECFTLNHATGIADATELPFEIPLPSAFDKETFDDEQGYWFMQYMINDNGDITITGSASMSHTCEMLVQWDEKSGFTLLKRGIYDTLSEAGDMDYSDEDITDDEYITTERSDTLFVNNVLLQIRYYSYSQMVGAAHGFAGISAMLFNRHTGQAYSRDDIFKTETTVGLRQLICSELINRWKATSRPEGNITEDTVWTQDTHFAITPEGFNFFYNDSDDIDIYPFANEGITIPYAKMIPFLREETAVWELAKESIKQ